VVASRKSQVGSRLIQAAHAAAAIARGKAVPGAVAHPAAAEPQPEPGATPPSAAPFREPDSDSA
jgi:hypothetical protein